LEGNGLSGDSSGLPLPAYLLLTRYQMVKITKRVVDAAQTLGADLFVWDDELPGLGSG
jgi:hypothetical protein